MGEKGTRLIHNQGRADTYTVHLEINDANTWGKKKRKRFDSMLESVEILTESETHFHYSQFEFLQVWYHVIM